MRLVQRRGGRSTSGPAGADRPLARPGPGGPVSRRRWWLLAVGGGTFGLVLVVLGVWLSRHLYPPPTDAYPLTTDVSARTGPVPGIYEVYPLPPAQLRNPQAVERAVDFLTSLQPDGTYILSTPGQPVVVPMDLAHAVIALTRVDRVNRAAAALTWLYGRMILPGQDSYDPSVGADYAGSWYDQIQTDGSPVLGTSRGRGESVGMALIATYSVYAEDPGYLSTRIGDVRVADLVAQSVDYLTRPTMQDATGRFYHSPSYQVSFNEECARMTLGLRLASEMLAQSGNAAGAARAATGAARGLAALQQRTDMSQGMAYDYYALGIWGMTTPNQARAELAWLKTTGLANRNGVKNWDWQLSQPQPPLIWLRWWIQSQTIAPSQTFDYAIANVTAGNLQTAVDIEHRWLSRQRPDGGFDDAFLFGLRVGFSPPTSYSAARFILLERLLTDVLGRSSPPPSAL